MLNFFSYDPIHLFKRVKARGSLFSKIKTYLRGKNYTVFLVLLGTTREQIKRQFECLSLAYQKRFHFPLFCMDVLLSCLKSKKKFVTIYYAEVIQNTLVFHSYDKIPSLHSSKSKYQSTNVINKNLIQMST